MPTGTVITGKHKDSESISKCAIIAHIRRYWLIRPMLKEPDELPGAAKLLLYRYREELEIRVSVSSIKSMTAKIHVKFGARW